MWNPITEPRLYTIESHKISERRSLQRKNGGCRTSSQRRREIVKPKKPEFLLKSGSYLPKYIRLFFFLELANVPLEDFDPFYSDAETFVIVTENKIIHRFTARSTLNLFSPFNPIRRTCISILHNWIYRWFMILAAFVDCCLLVYPHVEFPLTVYYVFGAIYAFDFTTNVIAKGLVLDQFAFLSNGWGIVDLILLLLYCVPSTKWLHFLCGLRPLKIAALLPNIKSMVEAVLRTVADLRDMFLLTLFATWIFALVGHQIYMGVSTQTCIYDFPEDGSIGKDRDEKWHTWVFNGTNEVPGSLCANSSFSLECRENLTCLERQELDTLYGSMGWALMSTIRLMQQDSWEEIYTNILVTAGPWHMLYFVVTLFLGSFYTLNMILAVVSKSYDELQKELNLAEKLECSRYERSMSSISCSSTDMQSNDEYRNSILDDDRLNVLPDCSDSYCTHPIKNMWTFFIRIMNMLAFDPFTELIMAFITVTNLIFLSMYHFRVEENQQLYNILVSGYEIFSVMFAVECLMKFIASGPISYFKDKWNIFEFILVVLSLFEFKFEFNPATMKVLLSLRALRVFKLARIWPTLNTLVTGVFRAIGNVSDMTVVAVGVFYMFCVAGLHLFGRNDEKTTEHPESHWHFRDFTHSFLVIFRLLCGEWKASMLECTDDHGWICIPFFLSAVIVLNLIVLNWLLVTFLHRFSNKKLSKKSNTVPSKPNMVSVAVNRFKWLGKWVKISIRKCFGIRSRESRNQPANSIIQQVTATGNGEIRDEMGGLPRRRSKFRDIMESKYFKHFNIGITIIAAVCLSLRDVNLKSRPQLEVIINVLESIISIFLGVESAIKIAALGFSSYIKIKWNFLDFIILLGDILNSIASLFGAGTVSFFRSMRVLRLFSNLEGMRVIFNSLEKAMTKIFEVLLVCLLIWLVFAIIGVQLLNGRLYRCNDDLDSELNYNKTECRGLNFSWENELYNFDDVGSAYYRVLEIITLKGWIEVFELAINSGDPDEGPIFENNLWIAGYFVAVILGGSFFAFNLFIGVLIDGLNEEKRKVENIEEHDDRVNGYQTTRKNMLQKFKQKLSQDDVHMWMCRRFMLRILMSKQFEILMLVNCVFNMVLLTSERRSASVLQMQVLAILNGLCTTVFATECLFKISALKWQFFKNPRNIFECFVEILSAFELIWTDLFAKTSFIPFRPGLLRLVRFAWASGLLRHFKAARGLRQLISVVQTSLPAFVNICVLLFSVIFVYATLGMGFFKYRKDIREYLGFDFGTLPEAFIILFPIITSAGWHGLMDLLISETDCEAPDPEKELYGGCGNTTIAGFFVISYLFITFVIFVNMFSAVILENYWRVLKIVEFELVDEHFKMFCEIWSQFDKNNSQCVDQNHLSDLFESFEPPFQCLKPNRCTISLMNMPIYKGNVVHCADVLDAVVTYFFFRKGAIPADKFSNYQNELKVEKNCKQDPITTTFQIQREQRCVKIIQQAWRNYIHTSL